VDTATIVVQSPYGRPLTLAYREGTTDLSAIGATNALWGHSGNEYQLRDHPPMSGWAIDVGAHVGAVSLALAIDHPDLRVLAVEALSENCEVLRESVRLNGLSNVEVIEAAAGAKVAKRVPVAYGWTSAENIDDAYVVNSRFVGGMLKDPSGTFAYPPGVSLSSLITAHGIDRVRFVKIDCEGCEWAFLRSPDIGRVDELIGEYHFGGGFAGIVDLLNATHTVTDLGGEDTTVGLFRAIVR